MWSNCRRIRPQDASEKKGGRKKASTVQAELLPALEAVVADHTAGSPVDEGIRWTNRSPRQVAEELQAQGFSICPDTVRRLLREELELSVRQARKDEAARSYPHRDEQFEYLAELRDWYLRKRWPVLSIDTKKKELLGNFFRPGAAYTDGCLRVLDHDFASFGAGRMVPYGIYDVAHNDGFVLLSHGADTSEMVCDALWRWWQVVGRKRYWHASGMLLLCDCGGSNGARQLRFKEDLKDLAMDLRRDLQVAHYPPGCSKYNPIERRMFCHVSRSLRGVVLKSLDVARGFIARTSTSTGLRVLAEITSKLYAKGRKATRRFLEIRPVEFDSFLPDLNYTLTSWGY
jgi:hypothetical protein